MGNNSAEQCRPSLITVSFTVQNHQPQIHHPTFANEATALGKVPVLWCVWLHSPSMHMTRWYNWWSQFGIGLKVWQWNFSLQTLGQNRVYSNSTNKVPSPCSNSILCYWSFFAVSARFVSFCVMHMNRNSSEWIIVIKVFKSVKCYTWFFLYFILSI